MILYALKARNWVGITYICKLIEGAISFRHPVLDRTNLHKSSTCGGKIIPFVSLGDEGPRLAWRSWGRSGAGYERPPKGFKRVIGP